MGKLIAIDPGSSCLGYAWFNAGYLTEAGVLNATGLYTMMEALRKLGRSHLKGPDLALVVEVPKFYPGPRSKADPRDLAALHQLAGFAAGTLDPMTTVLVTPDQWKAQVPKDIHNARTLAQLSPYEEAMLPKLPKTKAHNMVDAVGLGLWYLKRTKERK